MNIQSIKERLGRTAGKSFDLHERRPGEHQLITPIFHEDADMVDIYLQESPKDPALIRICDYGLTLMRLSYTYDVNTDSKQRILDGILANNGVKNHNGNLYIHYPRNSVSGHLAIRRMRPESLQHAIPTRHFWRIK